MIAPHSPSSERPADPGEDRGPSKSERTCVGCGKHAPLVELIRLVVSPEGEVAVDLAGGAFGRGAHVHPSSRCLAGAPKGLARSFRQAVRLRPDDLARAIARAGEQRAWGLLSSAVRSRHVVAGSDRVRALLRQGGAEELVVVAQDAAAAADLPEVARAVADGRAEAFGTKASLGDLTGRSELAVLAITSARLAGALRHTLRVTRSVAPANSASETQGNRPFQDADVAEDR